MPLVVAGYGGDVCLSMRWGARDILTDWASNDSLNAGMAGVFDIDLDQPEENVSDDELEDVSSRIMSGVVARASDAAVYSHASYNATSLLY